MGTMLKYIKLAVNGEVPVSFYGKPVGSWPNVDDIAEAIEKEIKG